MYETILSPIHYGGMQLKNRIIFAPTTFGLSDEEYLAKIRAIAQGGCAMIIVGDVPVGKSRFEKSLFDTKGFAFYQQVVKIAHDADCKVCAQLHQSDSNLLAMFKYIPGLLLKKITPAGCSAWGSAPYPIVWNPFITVMRKLLSVYSLWNF